MSYNCIEQRDGGLFITGTRVSLDSVAYAYLRDESPEEIVESFPVLTLGQILGALAYYDANREIVDKYLSAGRSDFETLRQQWRISHPSLYATLVEAKAETTVSRLRPR